MEAKEEISKLANSAQATLDVGIQSYVTSIEKKYFNDITEQQAAELDMISKMSLDYDEMCAYVRKFAKNGSALRRLEKIAEEQGYEVTGPLYRKEVSYSKTIQNLGQQVINGIYTAQDTTIKIALNMMKGKVDEYTALQDQEITVKEK